VVCYEATPVIQVSGRPAAPKTRRELAASGSSHIWLKYARDRRPSMRWIPWIEAGNSPKRGVRAGRACHGARCCGR